MNKVCTLLLVATAAVFAQDTFSGVPRIVAIGDVHGDDARLAAILDTAGLIDAQGKWSGGAAHLVLVGDFLDRGPESRKVMDRLMALEPQAIAAGGRVHALLGNHEAMNLFGQLSYVAPGDYESFRTPQSKADGDRPAGWKERRVAFGPKGIYGQWLRRHDAIVKINGVIFVHGGISPAFAKHSIEKINKEVRSEINGSSPPPNGYTTDPDGPLWYRGLVLERDADAKMMAHVDRVLATHGASRIVVGHTVVPLVQPRFLGKVLAIDTGLSRVYGDGPQGFLVIEDGKYYAHHRGKRLELPELGTTPSRYLVTAAELDPPGTALRKAIQSASGR